MKVLLVGSGGREHALAWQLAQSEKCEALYAAPGNAGMTECAECVDIAADDCEALCKFAVSENIDLVVIGPETPLVLGLADMLRAKNISVFGPSADAARIEGSKAFMKDLCTKYGVRTAAYGRFSDIESAIKFIREQGAPIVVKTDGLAAGKGVIIAQTEDEAIEAARDMLSGASFGDAGHEIVIEEFLDGEELSFFALCDGKTAVPFMSAQDHKRAYDGDKGPNTGGMGAYAPARMMDKALETQIMDDAILPVIRGMAKDVNPFNGVLFAGLMMTDMGLYVLEYNARFGDPECQAIMKLFDGDLLEVLNAAAHGRLDKAADQVFWRRGAALCVVMAAKGYPGTYDKGSLIKNLDEAAINDDVKIFHAGTALDKNGAITAIGGRVLGITALGADIDKAAAQAYRCLDLIDWPQGFARRDIGWRARTN